LHRSVRSQFWIPSGCSAGGLVISDFLRSFQRFTVLRPFFIWLYESALSPFWIFSRCTRFHLRRRPPDPHARQRRRRRRAALSRTGAARQIRGRVGERRQALTLGRNARYSTRQSSVARKFMRRRE